MAVRGLLGHLFHHKLLGSKVCSVEHLLENIPQKGRSHLEPVIQKEGSQKEKDKYHLLMYVYGIQKDGTHDPMCRATKETET